MKLKEYIIQEDMTIAQFSRRVKATPHTIHRLLTMKYDFSASLAARIERETRGKVRLKELLTEETILGADKKNEALNTYVKEEKKNDHNTEENQETHRD